MAQDPSILIVGAGPTGLVHALWLTKQGVKVRIIDRSSEPVKKSRAMAVQARTLELYRQLDISDSVVAAGHKNPSLNLWANGKPRARLCIGESGANLTPYPFILVYPQDQHEFLLIEKLQTLGVIVERQTEFIGFEDQPDHVLSHLRRQDGTEEFCRSTYLCGCDGASSVIRHQIGASFEGGTYKQMFYVADVKATGLEPAQEAHISLDRSDFVVVLPYGRSGLSRLIGIVTNGDPEKITFKDVHHRAIEGLGVKVENINWFSTYRVHHRVTDTFRKGRTFLLGDAAHVHSPVGGQGMNTGIIDAINLAWKLAAVLKAEAADSLLDTYNQERRVFANELVKTTDRVFTFVTAESKFADFIRRYIVPMVANIAFQMDILRKKIFKAVSQTTLNYRESALSAGKAGKVEGGDRLPWVQVADKDNFETLSQIAWQIHVYGSASSELKTWGLQNGIPVHDFVWDEKFGSAGLARDAIYLIRPDTYVGLAEPQASIKTLEQYFKDRYIELPQK